MSRSAQQLDSETESDNEEPEEDLRLNIKMDTPEEGHKREASQTVTRTVGSDEILLRERKSSTDSETGKERSKVGRRYSQSLEDAFLEQLPEKPT